MLRFARSRAVIVLSSAVLVACGPRPSRPMSIAPAPRPQEVASGSGAAPDGTVPRGRLPRDVRPVRYALGLTIVPSTDRFSGEARIIVDVDRATRRIWLHGKDLGVQRAYVVPDGGAPIAAEWKQQDDDGAAVLELAAEVPAGRAAIELVYEAPFDRQLRGLYRVDEAGESYAFTQFEPLSARQAFPSFDEPSFKTPFDVTLTVQAAHVAAGNTPVVDEQALPNGMKRVRFETTPPMPTYLVAWAVGPLDVVTAEPIPPSEVRSRPIPLRGIAAKGRGARLAYALEHTPRIVAALERWFGSELPYPKLDIVAVPDFGSGAMENVGLVTFRETLLLLDASSPESQKRGYAYVMAHELAHQWFGNLVTMPWWDDLWLNEAFATWMGNKIVRELYPDYEAEIGLLESVHWAMRVDSLTTARRIRQPIESSHDIRNAFDAITYQKGGGVLEMFERWIGPERFQAGVRRYLADHRHGNATGDDLLAALSAAAERDVATPFRMFLDQPGVPFVDTDVVCDGEGARLALRQSRYLPIGSTGSRAQTWQVPVCIRWASAGQERSLCTLLTEAEATVPLEGECPAWLVPNADGAGYYRAGIPGDELAKLRDAGWRRLTPREQLAIADGLRAAFDAGSLAAADFLGSLEPLARSDVRQVATVPMGALSFVEDYVVPEEQRAAVRAHGQRLYAPAMRRVRWAPRRGANEMPEDKVFRASLVGFLALTAQDAAVRREAARLGRAYVGHGTDGQLHPNVVGVDLVGTVLAVAVQDGDAAFFDALESRLFASDDALLRSHILSALGSTRDPALAARARALALDSRLRVNEVTATVQTQASEPETRDATWQWLKDNYDALVARLGPRAAYLPYVASGYCDAAHAEEVQAFFAPHVDDLPGGPRVLASVVEGIRLCAARAEAHRESARAHYARAR